MSIIITVSGKNIRQDVVRLLVESVVKAKYPHAYFSAIRKDPPTTRPLRFSEAQSNLGNAKSEAEALRDELQEWRDNMPEALQTTVKADELDEAIQALDEFISGCETAEDVEVNFPSMMG